MECTRSPIFFFTTPLRKPRMECACHPVALVSSGREAPAERRSNARILVVLLSARAGSGFLAILLGPRDGGFKARGRGVLRSGALFSLSGVGVPELSEVVMAPLLLLWQVAACSIH